MSDRLDFHSRPPRRPLARPQRFGYLLCQNLAGSQAGLAHQQDRLVLDRLYIAVEHPVAFLEEICPPAGSLKTRSPRPLSPGDSHEYGLLEVCSFDSGRWLSPTLLLVVPVFAQEQRVKQRIASVRRLGPEHGSAAL